MSALVQPSEVEAEPLNFRFVNRLPSLQVNSAVLQGDVDLAGAEPRTRPAVIPVRPPLSKPVGFLEIDVRVICWSDAPPEVARCPNTQM